MSAPAASGRSLLERAAELRASYQVAAKCQIGKLLAAMPPNDAADLMTLLRMDRYEMPGPVVVKTLADLGYKISSEALQAHRRNVTGGSGCKCPSSTTP